MESPEPAAAAESSASLYAGATLKSQRQSFGEVEKISFITLPGRRGQSEHLPWKMACLHLGGTGEGFYSSGSRLRLGSVVQWFSGSRLRLGFVQGLHCFHVVSGNLLMSFSGSFNLA